MNLAYFTTPPPALPPSAKHPLFTKKVFSTKSWSPGHVLGVGILAIGGYGLYRVVRDQIAAGRTTAGAGPGPGPSMASVDNDRGQYGKRP